MWSYLGTLDVEASLRGTAYAATGVAAMISPFIVGMIADRFFATQKVFGVLHLLGGVATTSSYGTIDWIKQLVVSGACLTTTPSKKLSELHRSNMSHPPRVETSSASNWFDPDRWKLTDVPGLDRCKPPSASDWFDPDHWKPTDVPELDRCKPPSANDWFDPDSRKPTDVPELDRCVPPDRFSESGSVSNYPEIT